MATLTVSIDIEGEIQDVIGNGLDEYNVGRAGPYNTENLWIVARDDAGAVEAGLKAKSEYSWLFVDWLWVDPGHRGKGLGAELLGKAEEVARARGCVGVFLGSFTFQAPEFYKRLGYGEAGRIEDFPPGHALVWLKKVL